MSQKKGASRSRKARIGRKAAVPPKPPARKPQTGTGRPKKKST